MDQVQGSVNNIIFRNEQNGFTVLELTTPDGGTVTAVGCMPLVQPGERLNISGNWTEHREYGIQFKAEQCRSVAPATLIGIERYLSSGLIKGVGEVTARNIVAHFGLKTLQVLENEPERLSEVEGIGTIRAELITTSFREQRFMREIMLALQEYGITVNQALKLYKLYGEACLSTLRENPYQLIEDVQNIGFKTADKIAKNVGIEHDSFFRLSAGIKYMLSYAYSEGHTCLPKEKLIELSAQILEVELSAVEETLETLIISSHLVLRELDGTECVFLPFALYQETDIAKRLLLLNAQKTGKPFINLEEEIRLLELETGIDLAPQQREAVLAALKTGVIVITGGPGTGKTTIISFILHLMDKLGMDVELCAPTGRAAKRITEATGREARTIHRLLEYNRSESFFRNEDNPVFSDVIILDEASMLDVSLMQALLKALPEGTRLILVGDADQLPPVGAGNVLSDIIESNTVRVIRLSEIFRQAERSLIVVNAHSINAGKMPNLGRSDSDFTFEQIESSESVLLRVVELCTKRFGPFAAFDPLKDVQVLSPMKKGVLGVHNLNLTLQRALNPAAKNKAEKLFGDTTFREGDKIMQIKNDYQAEWTRPLPRGGLETGLGVFNGDLGTLMNINFEENTATVLFDDERRVSYDFSQLDELDLAYCISVHKSQGSEFPALLLPLVSGPPMLLTRNLLYTAVTRAKKQVHIVGHSETVRRMVFNTVHRKRYSGLCTFLGELVSYI